MSESSTLRTRAPFALLLITGVLVAGFGSQLAGFGGPALPAIQPVWASGATILGVDCGLGSTVQVAAPATGRPSATGDGTLDPSCSWIGSVDGDSIRDPLVSDDPANSPFDDYGGGFSAEIRATGLPDFTNAFDLTVTWDPRYLYAVKFDVTGLPFE